MPKRLFFIALITALFCMLICVTSMAADDISLVINGKQIECEVPPLISNDRTLVPVRVLFEQMSAKVDWNSSLRQVVVKSEETVMIFNIDSKIMHLNGKAHTLDAAPIIVNDRTLVPVRFISEKLGYSVGWDGTKRTVSITKPAEHSSSVSITKPKPPAQDPDDNRTKFSSVKVNETLKAYEIIISLDKKTTPKTMSLSEPYRLIFDFYDVNQTIADGNISSNSDPVVQTRWACHDEYSRVVVETTEKCSYTISYISGKNCKITIKKSASSERDDETTSKPVVIPSGAPIVVIDAGHGGHDPGAVAKDEDGKDILYEKDVCLDISLKVENILSCSGVSAVMTRSKDTDFADSEMDDLVARTEIANNSGACLFVSIHNNAFTNPASTGTCVLYSGLSTGSDYGITGKEVAQNIQDSMVDATNLYDRGIIDSPGIVVLKKTVMPAVLVECAFITCSDDLKLLNSDSGRSKIAKAIADGIITSLKQMGRLK